ncbi:hypothetical protein JNUCC0626_19885 [Lentzea sp. JNUCC 0626]|uniref:hypothetical protein n=1 Tax=Lentzea sp. JNUCC 0626 TaxID=3367513 RepID=UPI003749A3EB
MGRQEFIVLVGPDRTLIDRHSLAFLTQRSVNTIRAHCQVETYHRRHALYDLDRARAVLAEVPVRGHSIVALPS